MLKIKHFNPQERGHDEQFNSFMESHSPRNGKNSPGIVLNQNGLYVFYEKGEPCTIVEQIAELTEAIRGHKYQIFQAEPMIRLKEEETAHFKQVLADAEAELTYGTSKESYDKNKKHKHDINDLKAKIDSNEAWLLTTKAGQEEARKQIKHIQSVLDDLQAGKWQP